ncbi:hypothetical protein, partial [Mycobacteroides sp. CBMA 326]|uniref:hypothetical protein n=1 Tax=Mycobacteroides sp. CBMA 326 TaxID=1904945 RepID=UPI00193DDF61
GLRRVGCPYAGCGDVLNVARLPRWVALVIAGVIAAPVLHCTVATGAVSHDSVGVIADAFRMPWATAYRLSASEVFAALSAAQT